MFKTSKNALGASDGIIHNSISHEVVSLWATTNEEREFEIKSILKRVLNKSFNFQAGNLNFLMFY